MLTVGRTCAFGYDNDNDVSTTDSATFRCGENATWVSTPESFTCPHTDYVQQYSSYQAHKGTGSSHTISFEVSGSTTAFSSYRYYKSYCSDCSSDAAFLQVVAKLCYESEGCAGFNYFSGARLSDSTRGSPRYNPPCHDDAAACRPPHMRLTWP